MKKILFLINMIMLLYFKTYSQTSLSPEYPLRPYSVVDSKLIDVERKDAAMKAATTSGLITWIVNGESSAIRFKRYNLPNFVMKIDGSGDPAESILLVKMDIGKNERIIPTGKKLGGQPKDISASIFRMKFEKIAIGIYQITVDNSLPPGEYSFLPVGESNNVNILSPSSIKVSCFGVDASASPTNPPHLLFPPSNEQMKEDLVGQKFGDWSVDAPKEVDRITRFEEKESGDGVRYKVEITFVKKVSGPDPRKVVTGYVVYKKDEKGLWSFSQLIPD